MTDLAVRDANDPETVFGELIEEITYNLAHRPRDLQVHLGPSEVGDPCPRALLAKLFGIPEPGSDLPNWRAWVGSCMHTGLEDIFAHSFMQQGPDGPRFLLETQVTVGILGDYQLTGHCDLFDQFTGLVIDYKTKSMTQHKAARRHGIAPVYRVQAHCYGLGMANLGYQVRNVMFVYLLRDGELSDSFFHSEPFNPLIAFAALERANQLWALGQMLGVQAAMALYPPCTEEFCRYCNNYRAPYAPPRAVKPTSIAEAIAQAKTIERPKK